MRGRRWRLGALAAVAAAVSYGGSCQEGGPVGTTSGGEVNAPPTIARIVIEPAAVPYGGTGRVTVTAQDPEGHGLSATWSADAGTVEPDAGDSLAATYRAPASGTDTEDTIRVTVTDSGGASSSSSAKVALTQPLAPGPTGTPKPDPTPQPTPTPTPQPTPEPTPQPTPTPTPQPNRSPTISCNPCNGHPPSASFELRCDDPDGDVLSVDITLVAGSCVIDCGSPSNWAGVNTCTVGLVAPDVDPYCEYTFRVRDGRGGQGGPVTFTLS